ncbi:HK97 gp10 family phage protein [Candidatus Pacearchaeota archaeon]|nr:HK97 gp10 family phage protein [Candidatus Pacearchaeota archaeon]
MPIVGDHTVAFMDEVRAEATRRLKVAAKLVEGDAKLNVPVDTGRLKKSIHAEISEDGLVAHIIADALRTTPASGGSVSYGWWVETGEGSGPAQPYMRPALHSNLDNIERIFA